MAVEAVRDEHQIACARLSKIAARLIGIAWRLELSIRLAGVVSHADRVVVLLILAQLVQIVQTDRVVQRVVVVFVDDNFKLFLAALERDIVIGLMIFGYGRGGRG